MMSVASPMSTAVRMHIALLLILGSSVALAGQVDPTSARGHQATVNDPAGTAAPPASARLDSPLTLEQAIAVALANNPGLAAMSWESTAARARSEQAARERWPRISAMGRYDHHLDEQRILPVRRQGDPTILSRDILAGDVVLSIPLWTSGLLSNKLQAADLQHQATEHRLARSQRELVYDVTGVFFGILAQQRVVESLAFSLRTLEEHQDRVEALLAARKAARVDLLRTDVRLADIRQRHVHERNDLAIQRRVLAHLMGLEDPLGEIEIMGDLELDDAIALPELGAAVAKAKSSREDYLAAQSTLAAIERTVVAEKGGSWPSLTLLGSYGSRWAAGPTTGDGEKSGELGQVGVVVDIPIFDGGHNRARVNESRADYAAAEARLRRLELVVRLEVETALMSIESAHERALAIRTAIVQARESLRIEREKYDLGSGTIVDVLDAQAALLDTETTYSRVLVDLRVAMARLALAMGAS